MTLQELTDTILAQHQLGVTVHQFPQNQNQIPCQLWSPFGLWRKVCSRLVNCPELTSNENPSKEFDACDGDVDYQGGYEAGSGRGDGLIVGIVVGAVADGGRSG